MNLPVIYLVGDAILDNFYWLENKKHDLTQELTVFGYDVKNLAVDKIRVTDISRGITPGILYKQGRHYPYPVEKDGKFYPLRNMALKGKSKPFNYIGGPAIVSSPKSTPRNMIVLSVGGDDLLSSAHIILLGIDRFISSILTKEFVEEYQRLIETMLEHCKRIVLISIYLPYLGPGSTYGMYSTFSGQILTKWNSFLEEQGKKYNIPILDLSKTVDSFDRSHYGTCENHLSDKASKCLASCLAYIERHYNGFQVYYAEKCQSSSIKIR